MSITGSNECIAHAQRAFLKVVLYLKMISRLCSISVPNFMLVSGMAQSSQNLALSRPTIIRGITFRLQCVVY